MWVAKATYTFPDSSWHFMLLLQKRGGEGKKRGKWNRFCDIMTLLKMYLQERAYIHNLPTGNSLKIEHHKSSGVSSLVINRQRRWKCYMYMDWNGAKHRWELKIHIYKFPMTARWLRMYIYTNKHWQGMDSKVYKRIMTEIGLFENYVKGHHHFEINPLSLHN